MEYSQAAGDTGSVAIGTGFERNAEDYRMSEEGAEIEGQLLRVGTDDDILTMPKPQNYFDLATEDYMRWL
jgi:hypothetical protein